MIKKLLFISALLAGSVPLAAQATPILSFTPSSQAVTLGDDASVDIVLSGLEDGGLNQVLSAFDITVSYDSAILGAFSLAIDLTPFDTSPLPLFNASFSSGEVQWDVTSLASDAVLQTLQGNSLTLGTLFFHSLSAGVSGLSFSYHDLTGLNALALQHTTLDGSITVNAPQTGNPSVPEPSSLLLMAIGAAGLTGLRRRQSVN